MSFDIKINIIQMELTKAKMLIDKSNLLEFIMELLKCFLKLLLLLKRQILQPGCLPKSFPVSPAKPNICMEWNNKQSKKSENRLTYGYDV